MQDFRWCNSCPWCDSCEGGYYLQNGYEEYLRGEEELQDTEEFEEDEGLEEYRGPRDVERVIRLINQRASRDINEMVRLGMDRKLVDFLLRSMVSYIDRNFNRYRGNTQQRIREATRDIRREFLWVFGIMNLYNVPNSTQVRLIDALVALSIENLRVTPPRPPIPPRPRPPVQR